MTTTLTRADIETISKSPKVIRAMEELFRAAAEGLLAQELNVAATAALQDATVLTLSPNDTFTNERVVSQGRGISLSDTGTNLVIALAFNFAVNGGYRLTFNTIADSDLNVRSSGTVMVSEDMESPTLAASTSYANDAAASAGGLPVGGFYRNGSVVQVRVT